MVSNLLGAREIRELATALDLRPTKKRGQNFVIDPNTVERIVRLAELPAGCRVLEIGPGLGSLTLALLEAEHEVVAVEIEPQLAQQLPITVAAHLPELASRLTVIEADALSVTSVPSEVTALVANLPYNISVPVLLHFLELFPNIERMLVMVQKEVADRLASGPGNRVYGTPSVKARWFGEVELVGTVGRSVFWPEPNIDSGLVRVVRTAPPVCAAPREYVFSVVDAAFSQRRKTLRGALAQFAGGPDRSETALRSAGIDPGARGETLTVVEFARLAEALMQA
ncbi:MAG: 16S rRNA (adenine(1518)-N(6)/adenine(1519)-N(6))-dimethyltransferase RsmA [Actinobacteria bacterium]|nr:16S rRNA (adenine(1518)-N(6)/adenine(1519)-N(6))-dimethyltransferase RsmA [Actinomycetota bacterium]MTB27797.1 16S rRNA (adenine(1518)-N(6)/adenine(1519)-N(6))-dimethyltransferase RsmA [Actinomycetota bacterium]